MPPTDRFWLWFLSGGERVAVDDPDYLRVAMINVIGVVAGLIWGLFLVYNLWRWPGTGDTMRVLVDVFGVAVSVGMVLAIRSNVSIDIGARVANVGAAVATLAAIYVRPDPAFSLMVFAIYPLLAFFLLDDVVEGMVWTAVVTVAACTMVLGGFGPWAQLGPGSIEQAATIVAVMVMESVTMAAYVHSRRYVLDRLAQVRAELAEQSIHDPLTGLYNRRTFEDTLRRYLSRAGRGPDGLAVAMIDIDHFKAYNDTYGHPAGDEVLRAIAEQVSRLFARGEDIVFRLGGEELCVLFLAGSREEARRMGERVSQSVAGLDHPSPGGPKENLTVSIGLSWVPPGELADAETIYRQSDEALYRAKAEGRGRLVETDAPTGRAHGGAGPFGPSNDDERQGASGASKESPR